MEEINYFAQLRKIKGQSSQVDHEYIISLIKYNLKHTCLGRIKADGKSQLQEIATGKDLFLLK